jgi:hypothetical protein
MRVGNPGCQKTLVEAGAATVTPTPGKVVRELTVSGFVLAADYPLLPQVSSGEDFRLLGRCNWHPPPTDLVTVLQHFLI